MHLETLYLLEILLPIRLRQTAIDRQGRPSSPKLSRFRRFSLKAKRYEPISMTGSDKHYYTKTYHEATKSSINQIESVNTLC
jgi:hypothetical protein